MKTEGFVRLQSSSQVPNQKDPGLIYNLVSISLHSNFTNMIDKILIPNSPNPTISKMWSAFFENLKLPEICRLINCPLIPGFSGYDCIVFVAWFLT